MIILQSHILFNFQVLRVKIEYSILSMLQDYSTYAVKVVYHPVLDVIFVEGFFIFMVSLVKDLAFIFIRISL